MLNRLVLTFWGLVSKVIGEGSSREGIPSLSTSDNILLFLLHATKGSNFEFYFLLLRVELVDVDLDILDLIFIPLEFGVSLVLIIEMRKYLVIDPELKGLALLDDIQSEPIESKRVLK